jgi:hypothetical protein
MVSKQKPHLRYYEGEWRRPINDLRHQQVGGGNKAIHDDETAKAAGFAQGAPIHGTVHWSQFTPLVCQAFGAKEWFERGIISVTFRSIVTDSQPVKAFIEIPSSKYEQVSCWMEHVDGRLVLEGTVGLNYPNRRNESPFLEQQLEKIKPVDGNLVFCNLKVGTKTLSLEKARISFDKVVGPLFPFILNEKLDIITEWHPWFDKEFGQQSPWKRPVLAPECWNQIMLYTMSDSNWPKPPYNFLPEGKTPVGLFGGCQVRLWSPIFADETYTISRELMAVGETPKTEFRFVRTQLKSISTGDLVAEMILQDMMLKSTIENYQNLRDQANSFVSRL